MRLGPHLVLSAAVSGALFAATRSWPLAVSSFLSGVLIDGDHLLEYVREYGWRFDLDLFFRASYSRAYKRVVLVLHAWEWLPVLAGAAWLSGWNPWIVGALAGWTQHLVADQLSNTPNVWAYSIVMRWRHGFDHRTCFPWHDRRDDKTPPSI